MRPNGCGAGLLCSRARHPERRSRGPLHPPGLRMAEALGEVQASLQRNLEVKKGAIARASGVFSAATLTGACSSPRGQEAIRPHVEDMQAIQATLEPDRWHVVPERQAQFQVLQAQCQASDDPNPATHGPRDVQLCPWAVCRGRGGGTCRRTTSTWNAGSDSPKGMSADSRPPSRRGPPRPGRPDVAVSPRCAPRTPGAVHRGESYGPIATARLRRVNGRPCSAARLCAVLAPRKNAPCYWQSSKTWYLHGYMEALYRVVELKILIE